MDMQQNIIDDLKNIIKKDDIINLRLYYFNIINNTSIEYSLNLQYIYKEILIFTCYNGTNKILNYLLDIYNLFDDVSKIALRQVFFYCKYILIRNKKDTKIIENFLKKIRIK